MFAVVVAEKITDPSFGGQNHPSVVGIDLRREPLGNKEHAEEGVEGFKSKPLAELSSDRPYREANEDGGDSRDHVEFVVWREGNLL